METQHSASLVINVPLDRIFTVLTEPARHCLVDGTGMVGAPEAPDRLAETGQVFTMNMTYRSGERVVDYQTDNLVTEFDAPRLVEWAPGPSGGEPLGWRWRYELEPVDGGTNVTLTYDWSRTPQENIERFGVPLVDEDGLRSSLTKLAEAAQS
jgi:hypothetical protein